MDTFEFDLDESLRASVERKLTGTTQHDSEIAAIPLSGLRWEIKVAVLMLRAYRSVAPQVVRNRCVFDPSCSHYSELAFRRHGLITGLHLTVRRLRRCRAGAGGIDFSHIEHGDTRNEVQG